MLLKSFQSSAFTDCKHCCLRLRHQSALQTQRVSFKGSRVQRPQSGTPLLVVSFGRHNTGLHSGGFGPYLSDLLKVGAIDSQQLSRLQCDDRGRACTEGVDKRELAKVIVWTKFR